MSQLADMVCSLVEQDVCRCTFSTCASQSVLHVLFHHLWVMWKGTNMLHSVVFTELVKFV